MLTLLCAVFSTTWGQNSTLSVDFESALDTYSDWTIVNFVQKEETNIDKAHGGKYFGDTNGKETASVTTKKIISHPASITCYYNKLSTNSNASSLFKIRVSSNGTTWTDVANGKTMDKVTRGTWEELTADLSSYSDVYVQVYYTGSTAKRCVDDISLSYSDGNTVAIPSISPASGTTFEDELEVSISCTTTGATIYYTTNGDVPTTNSTVYSAPFTITKTTTVKAIAVATGMTNSDVAIATYTKELPLKTIAEARTQATEEVRTKGVITSLNGNNAYIQDATAAIYIYGSCGSFSTGDEIIVKGTLSNHRGLLEITPTSCTRESSNNTVTPEVMTIAQVNASTNQGWLIKIEDATVQSIASNDQDVTIAQGTNTVLVRFNKTGDITFAVNDVITLTGNIGCYNTLQIANPRDIVVQENTEPTITVDPSVFNIDCNGGSNEMTLTLDNFAEEPESYEVQFYTAEGETTTNPDWVSVNTENMTFSVEANEGEARSAYFKVYADDIYSNLITINQEEYKAPPSKKTYQKVTKTDDITNGNYLIVYEGDKTHAAVAFKGSLETLDGDENTVSVAIIDNEIEDENDAYFTIDVANGTIKSASGNYIGVSSNSNGLKQSETADTYKNSFAIDENDENKHAIIAAVFEGSTMSIRYNYASDELRFRYYKNNGQQPIALYKEIEASDELKIIVKPDEVNGISAEGGDGLIEVTYKNFTEIASIGTWEYALDGEEEIECDWIRTNFDDAGNLEYEILPNDGEARTAYVVINAWDNNGETASSKTIVFNQDAYVPDFAEIPFEFSGTKADIENTNGLTENGIGSKNYSSSANLQFDTAGDWLILKLEEHPETALELAYDIKGNSFSGGTFTVQISADGETYTDLATYTELTNGATPQTEVFGLAADIRYIKWIYTTRSAGNVGLGNIVVIAPKNITVTFAKKAEGYSTLYYGTDNLKIPAEVKAYTYKVNDAGAAVETEYEGVIPAGSAVIVELIEKNVFDTANSYDVTFTTTANKGSIHTDNMLNGFDEGGETVGPDNTKEYYFYKLSLNMAGEEGSIGFYWHDAAGSAFTMPAHRAYLAVEKDLAGAPAFTFNGFGTNIRGINEQTMTTEGVYSISGVRVNGDRLPKGIYIVNGKKVVIK